MLEAWEFFTGDGGGAGWGSVVDSRVAQHAIQNVVLGATSQCATISCTMNFISVDGACKVFSAEVAVDKIQVVRRKSR